MTPADLARIYDDAYSKAFDLSSGGTVAHIAARAHLAGLSAVYHRGLTDAAGIAADAPLQDGQYIAAAIRRAAGGAE